MTVEVCGFFWSYTELNISNWKQERFYIIKKVFNRTIAIANALKDSAFEELCFAEFCKDIRAQTLGFVSHGKNSWNIKCLCLFVNTNYSPYTHSLLMSLSQRKHEMYIDLNCLQQNSTLYICANGNCRCTA